MNSKIIFQVVINLVVDAEQICKKSNNNNWIWNASDRLILIHGKFLSKNYPSAVTFHTFCFWEYKYAWTNVGFIWFSSLVCLLSKSWQGCPQIYFFCECAVHSRISHLSDFLEKIVIMDCRGIKHGSIISLFFAWW